MSFRASKYIDFDSGTVILAPMDLKVTMNVPWSSTQKIDMFECMVDVWQLGVAAEMLKQIEANNPPSIWSHAGYGLVSLSFTYFEMLGKTLNPSPGKSGEDFLHGFCDVYPTFAPANKILNDYLPFPPGPVAKGTKPTANPDIQDVIQFRDRVRNGLYHLAYTKKGVWLHNDTGSTDFEKKTIPDPANPTLTIDSYRVNPHLIVRTIVDHFPGFVNRIRTTPVLETRFVAFFDQLLTS